MNTPNLVSTQFRNLEDNTSSYGVRWYDDYENGYANFSESQNDVPTDKIALLNYAIANGGDAFKEFFQSTIIDSLDENKVIMVNNEIVDKMEASLILWGE